MMKSFTYIPVSLLLFLTIHFASRLHNSAEAKRKTDVIDKSDIFNNAKGNIKPAFVNHNETRTRKKSVHTRKMKKKHT